MGDFLRTTRESMINNLNPVLVATIRAHIEKYELGDIDSSALICCETTSTKQKKGAIWWQSRDNFDRCNTHSTVVNLGDEQG